MSVRIIFLFICFFIQNLLLAQNEVTGKYFGQKPPGIIPEIFAPGFISTNEWEAAGCFSPDGTEYYFTRRPNEQGADNRIFFTKLVNGKWTTPALAPFAKDLFEFESFISPDGKKLFFASERAKPEGITSKGEIWYLDKTNSRWSDPKYLGSPIDDSFVMYVTAASNGTLYFTGVFDRKHGIFRSKFIDGKYTQPEYLPDEINSLYAASHPFIAPDESYIIFDAQIKGMARPRLFLSFRNDDGSWCKAIDMGSEINVEDKEFGASVSHDGKYLFFHRTTNGNGDIYWVDAKIIDKLRGENIH